MPLPKMLIFMLFLGNSKTSSFSLSHTKTPSQRVVIFKEHPALLQFKLRYDFSLIQLS